MNNLNWQPSIWIAALLGLCVPPFAFLYCNRLFFFFSYLLVSLIVIFFAFHYPILLAIYAVTACIHAAFFCYHTKPLKQRPWHSTFIGILFSIYISITIVALLRTLVIEPYYVTGDSMSPNLQRHDVMLIKKWGLHDIERGKIYTLKFNNDNATYVKRLVGIPGDKVTMRGNHISINDIPITQEISIKESTLLFEKLEDNHYPIIDLLNITTRFSRNFFIKDNEYFFLGDNRSNSTDSRVEGTVDYSNIIGEVIFIMHSPFS